MANEYAVNQVDLKTIADAIREKGGTSGELMFPGGFADAIAAIQSGSGGSGLAYDMGEFTVAEDAGTRDIPHGLGTAPDFILVWTDDFAESGGNTLGVRVSCGMIYMKELFGLPQYLTSSARAKFPHNMYAVMNETDVSLNLYGGTSTAYGMQKEPTNETFSLSICGNANTKWRAGVTYKYFVSEKWW